MRKRFYFLKGFFTIIVIMLLAGIICLMVCQTWLKDVPFWGHFLESIGEAGIIAVILVVTIESFTRKRFLEEITRTRAQITSDVFYAILGQTVSDKILTEIVDNVIKQPFLRKELNVHYTLKPTDKAPKSVEGEITVKYQIENMTALTQQHRICTFMEKALVPDHGKSISFSNLIIESPTGTKTKVPITEKLENDAVVWFEHIISMAPKEKAIVTYKIETLFWRTYMANWVTMLPTEGFLFTINVPEKNLCIGAEAMHPAQDRFSTEVDNGYSKQWLLKGGILPYQGIQFWWFPK